MTYARDIIGSLFIVLLWGVMGCDECKVNADCEDGEMCVKGKCKAPSEPSGTDTVTAGVPTEPGTTGTGTGAGHPTDTQSGGDTGTSTGPGSTERDTDTDSQAASPTDTSSPPCGSASDCPAAGACEGYTCENGSCVLVLLNGTPCGEGAGGGCVSGTCVNGVCETRLLSGVACESDENPCTNDICVSGVCEHRAVSGAACPDDGNPCTEDVCEQGRCGVPLDGVSCTLDSNACTVERCVTGVCTAVALPEGTACDDGVWCNGTADTCQGGVCTPASGGEPCAVAGACRTASCEEPGAGQTEGACSLTLLTGTSCDDRQFCTGEEVCDNGVCTHVNIPCTGGVGQCVVEVCNGEFEMCENENLTDGTACAVQDGLACNGVEQCEGGECVSGSPYCPTFADCTQNVCHEAVDEGEPTCDGIQPAEDGIPCTSTNVCDGTGTRLCMDGVCADGETPACAPLEQDGNFCTYWLGCFEENGEPDCMGSQNNRNPFLEISCGETIPFDTTQKNNEVSAYGTTECPGNLTGGEVVIDLGEPDITWTATMTVEKKTIPDKELYILLVPDPCDPVSTCAMSSTTSVTGTNGSQPENTQSIVIDGIDGNRGRGTVTLTCQ